MIVGILDYISHSDDIWIFERKKSQRHELFQCITHIGLYSLHKQATIEYVTTNDASICSSASFWGIHTLQIQSICSSQNSHLFLCTTHTARRLETMGESVVQVQCIHSENCKHRGKWNGETLSALTLLSTFNLLSKLFTPFHNLQCFTRLY